MRISAGELVIHAGGDDPQYVDVSFVAPRDKPVALPPRPLAPLLGSIHDVSTALALWRGDIARLAAALTEDLLGRHGIQTIRRWVSTLTDEVAVLSVKCDGTLATAPWEVLPTGLDLPHVSVVRIVGGADRQDPMPLREPVPMLAAGWPNLFGAMAGIDRELNRLQTLATSRRLDVTLSSDPTRQELLTCWVGYVHRFFIWRHRFFTV